MQSLGNQDQAFEYLQLEEWQRWEGNQLLHTERLRLYQVHLEINETLIIAPTTSTASGRCAAGWAPTRPAGGPGRAFAGRSAAPGGGRGPDVGGTGPCCAGRAESSRRITLVQGRARAAGAPD